LLDTVYVQALLNRADQHHTVALRLLPRVQAALEVWVTEAVLIEIANALSAINRVLAVGFVRQCYSADNVRVVPVDTPLLIRGLQLYEARGDKTWSLTDCLSFVVMQEQGLTEAVTADHHFRQAGFRALMLEP
jgi:hypothetical protein